MFEFNYKKAVQSLNFFATKEGGIINKMKAIKLIWLSDRSHLRRYGRPIIMDQYFALPFGPVPSYTKDLAENNDYITDEERYYRDEYIIINDIHSFSSKNNIDSKVFSKTDLSILNEVYSDFGHIPEFDLAELSHNYPEWKRFEADLVSKIITRGEMNYMDFFNDPINNNDSIFNQSQELKDLAKDIYSENSSLTYGFC